MYDLVLFEYGIEGYGDVNPFGISRQEWCHNLMMTLATREHPPLLDNLLDLRWKPRLWVVCDAYDHKLYGGSIACHTHTFRCEKFFTLHSSLFTLKVASWFQLCGVVEGEDSVAERSGKV